MLLTSLLYCYGFIQNEENRIASDRGRTEGRDRGVAGHARHLQDGHVRRGVRLDRVSNNQAFVAGRLSVALNAISIVRTAEDSGNRSCPTTHGSPRSRAVAVMRMGNEHVMGVYVIWKFAKNKAAAKKFLVDQQLAYRSHFVRSKFYNFLRGRIHQGGFKTIRQLTAQDTHKPRGKSGADDDRREVHDELRDATTPVMDDLQHVPDPADVRRGCTGEVDPADAVDGFAQGSVCTASGRTRGSSDESLRSARQRPRRRGPSSPGHDRLRALALGCPGCDPLGGNVSTAMVMRSGRDVLGGPGDAVLGSERVQWPSCCRARGRQEARRGPPTGRWTIRAPGAAPREPAAAGSPQQRHFRVIVFLSATIVGPRSRARSSRA
jgi:hypothetical protein